MSVGCKLEMYSRLLHSKSRFSFLEPFHKLNVERVQALGNFRECLWIDGGDTRVQSGGIGLPKYKVLSDKNYKVNQRKVKRSYFIESREVD